MEPRSSAAEVERLAQLIQRWAEGKATLKEVRGYSNEELYAVARAGYAFYNQGKLAEARTVFQGLFAVNPRDPYFALALAVVELAAGNAEGALTAYDVAIKLDPEDAAAHIGRAEIRISQGLYSEAIQDLQQAVTVVKEDKRLKKKAKAMLTALRGR